MRQAEVRPHEVRLTEVRAAEVCVAELRAAKVRPDEDRIAEVRAAEVRTDAVVFVTPRVPGGHALHKLRDVIVVRHASSSTRLPAARHHLVRLLLAIDVGERLPVDVAHD